MPVTIAKRGDKYRIMEADKRHIAKNRSGTALDGGGHRARKSAERQMRAINRSIATRKKR